MQQILGILGGGQLGRMIALAAAEYGITCNIYDPDPGCCAGQVAALTVGNFSDTAALAKWATSLNAVTLEFENIPADSVEFLAHQIPVRPSAVLLRQTQDRLHEKQWMQNLGLPVAEFYPINTAEDLYQAATILQGDMFLKTRTFGYDGKGQVHIAAQRDRETLAQAFRYLSTPCIVEQAVNFQRELSLIIARNSSGATVCLPLVENHHENLAGGGKILRTTLAPAPNTDAAQQRKAQEVGIAIAESCNLEGLLAIEMFETTDGILLVNELAPRPHNSGHWSINGADCSQFHLLVRAALDLPLPQNIGYRPTRMTNILGTEAKDMRPLLKDESRWLHLYGKHDIKPGRKMGHINATLA